MEVAERKSWRFPRLAEYRFLRPEAFCPGAASRVKSSVQYMNGYMDQKEAAHLQVLKLIEQSPALSQRALAEGLGVSLGKTHYILKALLEKGLIKTENFRRSDNKLAYAYILTPKGLTEKFRLTKAYLARKESEYELLRAEIAALRLETHADQYIVAERD